MALGFGYYTLRNIMLGFVIGIILCLVTLSLEALFSTQEVTMLL